MSPIRESPLDSSQRQPALKDKPVLSRQLTQRYVGPRAEVLDDLRRRQRAEPSASDHVAIAREAGEEAGGEHVARAGGVDKLGDREGGNLPGPVAVDDHAALLRPGDDSEHALGAQIVERLVV